MIEKRIDQSFQSLFKNRYGYNSENGCKKSLFEQLDDCDRMDRKPLTESRTLNERYDKCRWFYVKGKNFELAGRPIRTQWDKVVVGVPTTLSDPEGFLKRMPGWDSPRGLKCSEVEEITPVSDNENWLTDNGLHITQRALDYLKTNGFPVFEVAASGEVLESGYNEALEEGKLDDIANTVATKLGQGKTYEVGNKQFKNLSDAEKYAEEHGGKLYEISNKEARAIHKGQDDLEARTKFNPFDSLEKNQGKADMLAAASKVKAERKLIKDYGPEKDEIKGLTDSLIEADTMDRELFIHIKGNAGNSKLMAARKALEAAGIEFEILNKDQICNDRVSGIYTTEALNNNDLNKDVMCKKFGWTADKYDEIAAEGSGDLANAKDPLY